MSTTKRLDHISSISDSKEQTEKYQGLIEELMNRVANDGNADDLETVLSHCKCVIYVFAAMSNIYVSAWKRYRSCCL